MRPMGEEQAGEGVVANDHIREEVGDMAVVVFRGLDGVEEMVVVEVIRVEEVEAIAGGEAEVNDTE